MAHQEFEPPIAEGLHEASKDAKAALIFVIIMAVVQLISVAAYSYNAAKDREEERAQQNLNRKMHVLEAIYDRQDKRYKDIEYPLISLRLVVLEIDKTCNDNKITHAEKNARISLFKEQRIKDKIALIQAFGLSQFLFGSDTFNRIKNFVAKIETTEALNQKQLCSLMSPAYDAELRQDNREIDQSMYNAMTITEQKMDLILKKEHIE